MIWLKNLTWPAVALICFLSTLLTSVVVGIPLFFILRGWMSPVAIAAAIGGLITTALTALGGVLLTKIGYQKGKGELSDDLADPNLTDEQIVAKVKSRRPPAYPAPPIVPAVAVPEEGELGEVPATTREP